MNKSLVCLSLEAILVLFLVGCFYNVYMAVITGTFSGATLKKLTGDIDVLEARSWCVWTCKSRHLSH